MLDTVLFALALPALLSRPSFVLSQPHFLAEHGDFTPVGAFGDYPLDVISKDKDTIDDKVVNNIHSSKISTNVAMRSGAGKDGVVLSSLFAAGGHMTCAQEYEGPFYCWGENSQGELGDGTTASRNIPTVINLGDGKTAVQVAVGSLHTTCVINDSGALFCWGSNGQGQLGDGTGVDRHIPTLIKLGDKETAVQVTIGWQHTCVINDSGALYCMGYNGFGALGEDTTTIRRYIPTLVKLADEEIIVQVAAGCLHTCMINDSGALNCMGYNRYGALGDGTTVNRHIPTLIKLGDKETAVQVVSGYYHTCVINDSGALYCWGYNGGGQLGDGTTVNRHIPTLIKLGDGENAVQVAAGQTQTCVINDSGALYCMGFNGQGQLGDGTTISRSIPTLIKLGDGETVVQVVAGTAHTCVLKDLKDSGGLICWGKNSSGQLGDNANTNILTATNGNVIMKIQTDQTSKTSTVKPTKQHSDKPSIVASDQPSKIPTMKPTKQHSDKPSLVASDQPSKNPTVKPTKKHSEKPSSEPLDKTYKLRLSVCSV